jgi:hypothetical protein
MSTSPGPPGWYGDPYGTPGLLRWWDGTQWTQATEPGQDVTAPLPQAPYGPAPRGNRALPWVLAGGAALVVLVLVVVVSVYAFRGHDDGGTVASSPSSTSSPTPTPSPSATATRPGTRSQVIGSVTDGTLGITYPRLGSPWTAADSSWLRPGYFTAGQVSVVQAPFESYTSFNATSLSGPLRPDESAGYTGPANLSTVAQRVTQRILREHFALNERRTSLFSGRTGVGGLTAWLERFRLDFPDATARNWKFTADTVMVLTIDAGHGKLGVLWLSAPDTFPNQGDLDQVLGNVRGS